MTIKVKIKFTGPNNAVDEISGLEVPYWAIIIGDLTDRIAETEAHLTRIMGLVVKIETGEE